jgi:hypothetical protein
MNPLTTVTEAARRSLHHLVHGDELTRRTSPSIKIGLRQLMATYTTAVAAGCPPALRDTGARVFSQFDEDGLILFLLSVVGTSTRRFVDIGAADGITGSNTANLAFNLGFHGIGIDGDRERIEYARRIYGAHDDTRYYPPVFIDTFVRRGSINHILEDAGFAGEVEVLSIDIDGNDYWIWEALEIVDPRIVIVEARPELGLEARVVPYEDDLKWSPERGDYLGASPAAFEALGRRKGYRLVGANRFGFNLLFVRDDLITPHIPVLDVEALASYPRFMEQAARFESVRHMPFVEV